MIVDILSLFSGILAGATLGMIGAGSGIVAVFILLYFMDTPIHQAITIALLSTCLSATSGSIKNYLKGNLELPIILGITTPSLLFVPLGVQISLMMSNVVLEVVYSLLTIIMAIVMWRNSFKDDIITSGIKEVSRSLRRKKIAKYVFIGSATGFLSGMLGFSGGVIIIPGLVILLNESMKKATANSIAIIACTSFCSFFTHIYMDGLTNYKIAVLFSIGSMLGVYLGSYLQSRSSNKMLKQMFAIFLILLGSLSLIKNLFFS